MSAVVAKEAMGFCSCGAQIEPGEQILIRSDGAIHVGCPERVSNSANQTTVTESSGFLFGDAELATIEQAKEVIGVNRISFDGATVLGIDTPRLAGQLARVYTLMTDGKYRTLEQIANASGCLETSASARLRDLRKSRFGSHTVVSRQVASSPGVYEYQLIVNEKRKIDGHRNAA